MCGCKYVCLQHEQNTCLYAWEYEKKGDFLRKTFNTGDSCFSPNSKRQSKLVSFTHGHSRTLTKWLFSPWWQRPPYLYDVVILTQTGFFPKPSLTKSFGFIFEPVICNCFGRYWQTMSSCWQRQFGGLRVQSNSWHGLLLLLLVFICLKISGHTLFRTERK